MVEFDQMYAGKQRQNESLLIENGVSIYIKVRFHLPAHPLVRFSQKIVRTIIITMRMYFLT